MEHDFTWSVGVTARIGDAWHDRLCSQLDVVKYLDDYRIELITLR
jgi:hypothetical protein